jgi:hypothetical protein
MFSNAGSIEEIRSQQESSTWPEEFHVKGNNYVRRQEILRHVAT